MQHGAGNSRSCQASEQAHASHEGAEWTEIDMGKREREKKKRKREKEKRKEKEELKLEGGVARQSRGARV